MSVGGSLRASEGGKGVDERKPKRWRKGGRRMTRAACHRSLAAPLVAPLMAPLVAPLVAPLIAPLVAPLDTPLDVVQAVQRCDSSAPVRDEKAYMC